MASAPNPCTESFFGQVIKGNAILCSDTFRNYEIKSGQEQIQGAADRAAANLAGSPDDPALQAEARTAAIAAAQQEAHVASDVNTITQDVGNSKLGQVFTTCDNGDGGIAIPGLPCIPFKYLLYGAGALILLYVLALVSSLVPRPR